jgi:hypothetical protein
MTDSLDLAILKVDTGLGNRAPLPLLSSENARRGDRIHVLGFPGISDRMFGTFDILPSSEADVTASTGTITNANTTSMDTRYLQHDAFTSGGSSGGPVLNDKGQVIGVHTFADAVAGTAKGAVFIDYIIEQCIRLGIPYVPASTGGGFNVWLIFVAIAVVGVVFAVIFFISKRGKPARPARVSYPQANSNIPPTVKPSVTTAKASLHLICTKGNFAGMTFPVGDGGLTIGRDPKVCQIVFPNETTGISSVHCELKPYGNGIALIDRGSSYGTFTAAGRKITPNETVSLKTGDIFYLADKNNEFKVL